MNYTKMNRLKKNLRVDLTENVSELICKYVVEKDITNVKSLFDLLQNYNKKNVLGKRLKKYFIIWLYLGRDNKKMLHFILKKIKSYKYKYDLSEDVSDFSDDVRLMIKKAEGTLNCESINIMSILYELREVNNHNDLNYIVQSLKITKEQWDDFLEYCSGFDN